MSAPRDDTMDPAEARAMFATGAVLVALSAGYAAFRIAMVVRGDSFPGFWFGTEVTIAFLVSFLGAGFTIIADRTEHDRSLLPAFALLFLGAAAGLVLAALVFGVPPFIAGALLLAGLLLLLLHLRRRRRTGKLLSEGRRAEAVVAHVQRSNDDGDSFYVEVGYTLSFPGEDGAPHTVKGRATFPTGKRPEPGETVTIWYDPRRPERHVLRRHHTGDTEPR
ncbi:DUF3592 domain-containing protein [Streptomyces sp. PT12]|uniref:DUF3592 domain-containing protein n=1 Tax=Streptomyces sp. PT12 TaxID=1510197 RepID=UPI000DE51BF5|nr:DUF3592 domain-containing protein [Streptomyces sp. PT12]RBM18689.1 DUF3592 domain-containing protein [Streptomyces sp. PT12]